MDSQSTMVVNKNKLEDRQQNSHQEFSKNIDNLKVSFSAHISKFFDNIKEADAKRKDLELKC